MDQISLEYLVIFKIKVSNRQTHRDPFFTGNVGNSFPPDFSAVSVKMLHPGPCWRVLLPGFCCQGFTDRDLFSPSQALSVGIFPYVLKLLQSSARELRPLLVFIWAKILAVDSVSIAAPACLVGLSSALSRALLAGGSNK